MDVTGIFRLLLLILGIYLVLVTSAENDSSNDDQAISKEECTNAANFTTVKSFCCLPLEFTDEPTKVCIQSMQKHPQTDDANNNFVQLSLLTECIYKKRNFIKSHNRLNMTAVKDYAEWFYPHRAEEQNFIIDMYTFCSQNAAQIMKSTYNDAKGKELLKGAHKPYFMFVFMCVMGYPGHACPYYIWRGQQSNKILCAEYAYQCRERYFKNTSSTDEK